MKYTSHYCVLLREVLENINSSNESPLKIADLTFGGGGHTFALLEQFPNSVLYAVDQDKEAFENGIQKIEQRNLIDRVNLYNINYEDFPSYFNKLQPDEELDLIIMDIGVSSHHFDDARRGFSFRADGPLDMRMNQASEVTAAQIVNNYDYENLVRIFREYGEERFASSIANRIIEVRSKEYIDSTKNLEEICFYAYPPKMRHGKTHPATRVFQALRLEVNRELEVLENTLPKLYDMLSDYGRLMVISFHSLEDRIVKHTFKKIFQSEENFAKIITKRPIVPSQQELEENNRSRSAKLRVIEKNTMEGLESDKQNKYSEKKKKSSKKLSNK